MKNVRTVKSWSFTLLALLATLLPLSCERTPERIVRIADRSTVSFSTMIDDFAGVPIVFVGELHNRLEHHRGQLEVIQALHERGVPLAIGLEMFHDGHQEELDRWVARTMETEEFLSVYYHNWSSPWALYREIFLFARKEGIPMLGLNVSPEITDQVAAHGFSSLSDRQLDRLPGVSCSVDPQYESFIRKAHGEHGWSGESFRRFCEAQMVWDTTMAWKATEYIARHPGATMVVLAGSGHSWKRGIPEQVRQRSSLSFRTVVPAVDERLSFDNVTDGDTDYLWMGM